MVQGADFCDCGGGWVCDVVGPRQGRRAAFAFPGPPGCPPPFPPLCVSSVASSCLCSCRKAACSPLEERGVGRGGVLGRGEQQLSPECPGPAPQLCLPQAEWLGDTSGDRAPECKCHPVPCLTPRGGHGGLVPRDSKSMDIIDSASPSPPTSWCPPHAWGCCAMGDRAPTHEWTSR